MATIDKKLIHFNRKTDFEARLAAGDIRDYSIVCIKDAKLIWTHGQYYGDLSECLTKYPQEFTKEEKDQMLENLGYYFIEWDGESETIELSEEEYTKFLVATVPLLAMGGRLFYPTMTEIGFGAAYRVESGFAATSVYIMSYLPQVLNVHIEEINIPSKTSDLENDSSFVSAVDTGEEVDDVEVNYVTEAELTSGLAKKQDKLVSGTNIKTINGESILGSGDIVIEGGSSNGVSGAYAEVNHGTGDTTFALTPNTFHVWDEVASLDLSFVDEQAGLANEYLFQFTSGATATTLTLPDVKWANDSAPTIAENMIYQVSVLKGLASVLEFSNKGLFPMILYYSTNSNKEYKKVYQELESRGVPGTLESGLLFVDYNGTIGEVTEYSSGGTRGLHLYSFGAPIYYDVYLASDGSMYSIFND